MYPFRLQSPQRFFIRLHELHMIHSRIVNRGICKRMLRHHPNFNILQIKPVKRWIFQEVRAEFLDSGVFDFNRVDERVMNWSGVKMTDFGVFYEEFSEILA